MSNLFVFSAGIAMLLFSVISRAQPQGITMDMINTTLPLEGAAPAKSGAYEVASEGAFGSPGIFLFRPADLGAFPVNDTLPVLVWGNGGCAVDSTRYSGFLSTIASHGFLVLATAEVEQKAKRQANANDLRSAIDWAEAENKRQGSPLKGKIDIARIAVMGQSCGGILSVSLGADSRVATIGVFNSGVQPPDPNAPASQFPTTDALARLHGPVLLINGHERDFMMKTSAANFALINHAPVFYGARHNAGHTATVFHPGGGEFANVAANWLRYQFKGNKEAGKMFVGKDCLLCTNPNWDTDSKGLD
jgi:predicted alpha/beta-hydrolase family hydrolase